MELVFDPYTGKMVDPQTGLPMGLPPGYAPPGRVNVFEQMMNGTGIPERVNALNQVFNPVNALGDAGNAAEVMLAPETSGWGRVGAAGQMLSGMSGAVVPMVAAARGGLPAAQAVEEAMIGFAPKGNAFLADEFGGIKLYHGSPHDFDRFSMDKIGTGEGAQAYGHGLYFAESEDTAKAYRDALQFPRIDGAATPVEWVADDLNYHRGDVEGVKKIYQGMLQNGTPEAKALAQEKLSALPDALERFKGRLYEVEVNANPEDFLDWDAPLIAQPQRMQDAADFARDEVVKKRYGDRAASFGSGVPADLKAELPYGRAMGAATGGDVLSPDVSAALRAKGIPGIKYLDAGSRGAGDGSRNYVVFDENLISIVRKYGVAGAAAMLGLTQADVQAAMGGPIQ